MRRDLIVDGEGEGRILRAWLAEKLPEIPAKGIRRAIQRGQITVDGQRVSSSHILKAGQAVLVHIQDKFNSTIDLSGVEILFEDDDVAAVFKPEGLEIHGRQIPSLAGAMKKLLRPSHAPDFILNPVVLHRLDKPTCGVLLLAKSKRALKSVSDQFQQRSIQKQYLAVVRGRIDRDLVIDKPIDGKDAITHLLKDRQVSHPTIENATVLHVFPKTGRKHQIRRHLASLGLPIVGDMKYGKQEERPDHLLLCAEAITFQHPNGEEMRIHCEAPEYFGLQPGSKGLRHEFPHW